MQLTIAMKTWWDNWFTSTGRAVITSIATPDPIFQYGGGIFSGCNYRMIIPEILATEWKHLYGCNSSEKMCSGVYRMCTALYPRASDPSSHAVTVVGYGREDGEDFWIIKNSWETSYGGNGFIRMKRGTGMCNIGKVCTRKLVANIFVTCLKRNYAMLYGLLCPFCSHWV